MIKKVIHYLVHDIWRIPLTNYSRRKSNLINLLRIIIISIKGYSTDKIELRASALTFFSMLSVVPLVAMALAIAQGFGFEAVLHDQLVQNLKGQEVVINWILEFANRFLVTLQGGVVAGFGIVILMWTIMSVMGSIESSFNDIWQVNKSRTWARKFSDYLSMILIAPVLILLASSLKVYIIANITELTDKFAVLDFFGPTLFFMLKAIPILLIWLVFAIIYVVMPNTKVKWSSAIVGALIAGTLFHILQWGYIKSQIGLSKYNAVYGSFAALPFFLIWLQYSWLILLFGAKLCFSYQNVENFEYENEIENLSAKNRQLIALLIVRQVVKRFEQGEEPYTAAQLAHELGAPVRLVQSIAYEMIACKIFSEVSTDNQKLVGYQPAIDIQKITIGFVLQRLGNKGSEHLPIQDSEIIERLKLVQERLFDTIQQSEGNKRLADL